MSKRLKVLLGAVTGAALLAAAVFFLILPGCYFLKLDRAGIFGNKARGAVPQTAVHEVVMEFFRADHGGRSPKCLIIGYDGARADALINTKDDPAAGTQILKADGGAIYNMYTGGKKGSLKFQDTSTAPGWTTMLTGHWAKEKNGAGHTVKSNGVTKPVEPGLVFTRLLEEGLVRRTAFIVSWGGHFESENAAYLNDMAYCADRGYDAEWITTGDDAETFGETLTQLQNPMNADLIMCVLEYCDHAGHGKAFGNAVPEYVQAIKDSEEAGARLIETVKARAGYAHEDWLIIIASDHGGVFGGHGPQFAGCRQVFLAANRKVWG